MKKPNKAPPLPVRLSIEDRELLARVAKLDGVKDAELVAGIVSAELARRKRKLDRMGKAALRKTEAAEAAAKQIDLFGEKRA